MLDSFTIDQLQSFVAVCEEQSFSAAARKLGSAHRPAASGIGL